MTNITCKYALLSLALLSALPATAMTRYGHKDESVFEYTINNAIRHPFYAAAFTGAGAAAAAYFYNPQRTKQFVQNAAQTSGIANAMIVGGTIGTGAGLLTNYMSQSGFPLPEVVGIIAGMAAYNSTFAFMERNNLSKSNGLALAFGLSTFLYQTDLISKLARPK